MVLNLDTKIYLALVGGALIGISSSLNYIFYGKITGLSGMLFKVLSLKFDEIYVDKLSFLVGMITFIQVYQYTFGGAIYGETVLDLEPEFNPVLIALGSLLVGVGVRWGGGCTSGHGVCGIPRLSKRSLIAVPIFMLTGIITSTSLFYLPALPPLFTFPDSFKFPYYFYIALVLLSLIQLVTLFFVVSIILKPGKMYQKLAPVFYLFTGGLFGAGLLVSGMTSRNKILSFLTINGNWDPSLAFVMASAVGINLVTFQLVIRKNSAVFCESVDLPDCNVDTGIFAGPALFGVGWGITGFCPGPALVNVPVLSFAVPMVLLIYAGQVLHDFLEEKREQGKRKLHDIEVPMINRY